MNWSSISSICKIEAIFLFPNSFIIDCFSIFNFEKEKKIYIHFVLCLSLHFNDNNSLITFCFIGLCSVHHYRFFRRSIWIALTSMFHSIQWIEKVVVTLFSNVFLIFILFASNNNTKAHTNTRCNYWPKIDRHMYKKVGMKFIVQCVFLSSILSKMCYWIKKL